MRFSTKTKFLISLAFFVGMLGFSYTANASAALCGLLASAPTGNCAEGQNYTSSALTNLEPGDSSDLLKSKFLARMEFFNSSSAQHFQRVGARYILQELSGSTDIDTFKRRINQESVTLAVGNQVFDYNTAYDTAADAVLRYPHNDTRLSVKLYQRDPTGTVRFMGAIKLDCGNPLDDLKRIDLFDWTLQGETKVQVGSSGPESLQVSVPNTGTTVRFHHKITNNGPDPADYNYWVRGSLGNATYTNGSLPSGTRDRVGDGTSSPSDLVVSYTFPAGTPNGTRYCQRIYFSQADGPATAERYSPRACVTLGTGTSGSGSGECFSLTIPRPSTFGAGGYTTRTTYEVQGTDAVSGEIRSTDSKDSVTISYKPTRAAPIRIILKTQYNNTDPVDWKDEFSSGINYTAPVDKQVTCYRATCILTAVGKGPGGLAEAGGQVDIYGQIYNDPVSSTYPDKQDLPSTLPGGQKLGLTTGGPVEHPLGSGVELGDVQPDGSTSFFLGTINALGNAGVQTVSNFAYPDYFNSGAIGAICPDISFSVYKKFELRPYADLTLNGTEENPLSFDYVTRVENTSSSTVTLPARSQFYIEPYGQPRSDLNTFNGGTFPGNSSTNQLVGNYAVSTRNPGDKYCLYISLDYSQGYVGPGGPTDLKYLTAPADKISNCYTVHNEPYAHFLGSDVAAGGAFKGGNCSNSGSIRTFTNATGPSTNLGTPPIGSGVQIGALSIGPIEGFSSANLRGSFPTGTTGLSFSNTNNITGSVANGSVNLGGNMGGSRCATDYYATLPDGTANDTSNTTPASFSGTAAAPKIVKKYTPNSGTLSINGLTISDNTRVAIYVEGNVRITGPIRYANTNWANVESIPSLYIMVKGGSIYVDPSVTQLDGVYVAQRNATNVGGSIYTCSTGTSQLSGSTLLNSCRSQLLVNGAFVAQKVYLERSFGSLRNSAAGERLQLVNKACGDSGTTTLGDCAAEIFNYGPEMYLAQPAITPIGGTSTGKFDFITSLAPVL